jgi:phosphoglycolate phosphatase
MQTYVELMIFDFDGTLVQSGEDIANSVNYTLGTLNLPTLDNEVILTFIGDGVLKLIERATGEADQANRERAMEIFSNHYDQHMLDHAALYTGVYEMLNHFREKRKIILTNKRFKYAAKMAAVLNILGFFEEIIGADSTPFIKPDLQLTEMILQRYPVKKENTVIIGDGVNDILLAKNSGIISCGFMNGLGKKNDLLALNPDIIFEHFEELKDKLI